ncbi:MAG TPA: hypothetical protein VKM93_01285 [Terriglobia bacterium]|nr:hypothetical protein [Terriglobia bacterium]
MMSFARSLRFETRSFHSQFFGGKFDYFAVTPDVDWQARARMLDNGFLNAALSAISARCSNGNSRTFAGGLIMVFRQFSVFRLQFSGRSSSMRKLRH